MQLSRAGASVALRTVSRPQVGKRNVRHMAPANGLSTNQDKIERQSQSDFEIRQVLERAGHVLDGHAALRIEVNSSSFPEGFPEGSQDALLETLAKSLDPNLGHAFIELHNDRCRKLLYSKNGAAALPLAQYFFDGIHITDTGNSKFLVLSKPK
jgi:hypothetical protein